jgi:hypothetical protein
MRYAVIETALCIGGNLHECEVLMVRADEHDRELAALRETLEHIEKTCGQSRTVTRRLRWIGKRCELVLAGRPYVASEHELPLNAESEHFKLMRQNGRIKERLAAAEQRNADQLALLGRALQAIRMVGRQDHLCDYALAGNVQAEIEAALFHQPTESGAIE